MIKKIVLTSILAFSLLFGGFVMAASYPATAKTAVGSDITVDANTVAKPVVKKTVKTTTPVKKKKIISKKKKTKAKSTTGITKPTGATKKQSKTTVQ